MCCFTGPVEKVDNTRIFARKTAARTQALVYQMRFASAVDNAMVLPLPVKTPATEASIRFVDLHGYRDFFAELDEGFPVKPPFQLTRSKSATVSASAAAIAVHEVGDYVASFVPTIADFSRLDPRFQIAPELWAQVDGYADYGFAVFQLTTRSGEPHPMAFEFETRLADELFFPTVHIHDGQVHTEETFDHTLYLQHEAFDPVVGDYEDHDVKDAATGLVRSVGFADEFADPERAKGLIEGRLLVHRTRLAGVRPNKDQLFGVPEPLLVPHAVRKWGPRVGLAALAAAGVGFIIERRRRRARERDEALNGPAARGEET
ncbi:MAG: hypothetical protein IPM79_32330 [Polyangiaceae bacterium]|jgi:hypothetical protein|nr:hypothetical protein [Polyangiaceae bacterium]